MAVLDLSCQLQRMRDGYGKNRVRRVGIEVEGVWAPAPAPRLHICTMHRDTSVRNFSVDVLGSPGAWIGELVSPPLPPLAMPSWIAAHFPQHVNHTCGLHIHMSVQDVYVYTRLMDRDYHDTLLHYLTLWGTSVGIPADHCFWPRLRGENEYCQTKFWPDLQAAAREKVYDRTRHGHRYTAVNYCYGLGMGTVEVRVLPMLSTPALCSDALQTVLDVTNAFLAVAKRQPLRLSVMLTNEEEHLSPTVDRAVVLYAR